MKANIKTDLCSFEKLFVYVSKKAVNKKNITKTLMISNMLFILSRVILHSPSDKTSTYFNFNL